MHSASVLIQCEPWWTATEEAQAYARLFRPLQEKVVEVYYLDAVDSAIGALIENIRDSKGAANSSKGAANERIMGPLRRKDNEPPQIPTILKHY